MIKTRLYLSLERESGPDITEDEIKAFLKICVMPRFDGVVTYKATRNWRGNPENIIILEIIHNHGDINIQTVARIYGHVFNQNWIQRTDQEVSIEIIRTDKSLGHEIHVGHKHKESVSTEPPDVIKKIPSIVPWHNNSDLPNKEIPYTVTEARAATKNPMNPYHKDLILWLCDKVEKQEKALATAELKWEEGRNQ